MPATATPPAPTKDKEYNPADSTTVPKALPGFRESLQKVADKADAKREADAPKPETPPTVPAPPAAPTAPVTPDAPSTPASPVTEAPKGEPKQLREAYDKLAAERDKAANRLKELEETGTASAKTIETLTGKLAGMEERLTKLSAAEERLKEVETEHELALEKLRIADYVQHPEFHEKYVKPVAEAVRGAQELMKELVVTDLTTGGQRQATDNDFMAVLRAPNLTEAIRRAKETFGDDVAQMIVGLRNNVLVSERARAQAFESAALRSKEALERQQREAQDADARLKIEYDQISGSILEKDEGLWRPNQAQEDKEAAAAYAEAVALADSTVNGNPKWTAKERLEAIARVRHRAANEPVLRLRVKRLADENAALKARLAAFEKSEPSAGGGGREAGNGNPTDPVARRHAELQAIADRSRH